MRVYRKRTACRCIHVCLYRWVHMCIQHGTCRPLGMCVRPHLRDGAPGDVGETVYSEASATGDSGCTPLWADPGNSVSALCLASDRKIPFSAHHRLGSGPWRVLAVLTLARKDFFLCAAPLCTCLAVMAAGRPDRRWRGSCSAGAAALRRVGRC